MSNSPFGTVNNQVRDKTRPSSMYLRSGGGVRGSLCATGEGKRSNVSGAPVEAGGMPIVRSGSDSGLASDILYVAQ